MHCAFICNEYPPAPHGGNGSLYSDLAEGLTAEGHKVTVAGIYPSKALGVLPHETTTPSGVRIVRLPSSPAWMPYRVRTWWERRRQFSWLKREHHAQPFDIIEAADYEGWLCFGGPRGVASIVRMGGSNLFFDTELSRSGDAFEHQLEAKSVFKATHLAAVSGYCARRTLEIVGSPERPCAVIHNAVDTELFCPAKTSEAEPGLIVFVNSVAPKKGIAQLVQAMNVVCEKNPKAKLVVIGQDTQKKTPAGTYVKQLQSLLHPDYRDRVVFTGRMQRNEIIPWIQRAAVCCYPSHMETFGIAPVEAMSIGRPTIFSKTGPGPEVLEDGVSGLLCDPHNSADIARCITTLLDDSALAQRLGDAARARVLALFDRRDWVRRNVEFFQSCVASLPKNVRGG